ncbi:MAG: DUF58 domain-containing protein [Bacteriovoracaceae bacterium]
MFYTHFNLSQIQIEAFSIESSYAEQWGLVKIKVKNRASFPRYLVKVRFQSSSAYKIEELIIPLLPAGETLEFTQEIKLFRRGAQVLRRVELSTTFPFSFFRTFTYFHYQYKFYIYPKPLHFQYDLSQIESIEIDPDDDNLNLQPFRHGDSYRHIHWKKFALNETLLIKEMEQSQGKDFLVRADELVGAFPIEQQLSYLAYLVSDLMSKGFYFGLIYRDYNFEPSRDKEQVKKILEKLSVVGLS